MQLHDSRRLTGPNLFSHHRGAVLDAYLGAGEAEAINATVAAWRRQAQRMLDAVGWRGEELAVRRFGAGASLFLSAPLDCLYAATEVNEWAWEVAVAAVAGSGPVGEAVATVVGGGTAGGLARATGRSDAAAGGTDRAAAETGSAAFEAAAHRLRAAIARERDPALLALRDAAAAHGVAFLADDEQATVGLGNGSLTWARGELPVPAAVDWASVHDIPVALVTGTNGKTTTVRLAAAMLTAAGHMVGMTSTDHISVGGAVLDVGDYSGPGGARTLLRDRRVEAAVLETARGGLLRRGLALDRVAAAAVTNVAADHLGGYGIEDVAGLAEAKLLVTRAVDPGGRAVLNADDPELAARGSRGPSPVTWYSLEPRLEPQRPTPAAGLDLAAHLAAGGDAVLLAGAELVLARGAGRRDVVAAVSEVPIAFGGAARYNLANALAAIGLGAALGLPVEAMARGIAALRNDDGTDNPGRGYLMELDGFHALVDYAHNPHGLAALNGFVSSLPAQRRLLVLGQAGDRDDQAIRDLARAAWSLRPDRVILKELPAMLRGRLPGQVPAILEGELLRLGARREDLSHAPTELEAVLQALDWARPGDLLLLFVHKQRDEAMAVLQQRRGGGR
jgi:cyanophycin synthetase